MICVNAYTHKFSIIGVGGINRVGGKFLVNNKRGGWIKRGEWKFCSKQINTVGGNFYFACYIKEPQKNKQQKDPLSCMRTL